MGKYKTESLFETEQDSQVLQPGSHIIRVAFDTGVDTQFDYLVPDKLAPIEAGQRVEVPFGRKNKLEKGFCVETDISPEQSFAGRGRERRLKKVTALIDKKPLVDAGLMKLAKWVSNYYVCPLGQVLAAMIPSAVKRSVGAKKQKLVFLADDWQEQIESLRGTRQKQIVEILKTGAAFGAESAVEMQTLLTKVGCTEAPIKKLAEKLIIRIVHKTVFRSLPVVPDGMSLTSETVILNRDQQKALSHINSEMASGRFGVTLLHGVTDSGKTEVYIRAIEQAVAKSKTAIVLLPEIALTAQTVQRFSNRFERIAVMHSGLTSSQRNSQWQRIKAGEADVVIGARSAVFAPLAGLGLIVVDEEHEASYKQDTAPRYNGRDVAIKRAQLSNAHCILGSATPALQTLFNCRSKKYFNIVRLPKRVMNLAPPEMKLVDLQDEFFTAKNVSLISEPLARRLRETLEKKEQAILLLNRRGYSNFVFCPSCRHSLHCRNCDVTLTFHRSASQRVGRKQTVTGRHIDSGFAMCHYCGAQTLVPEKCPLCGKAMVMVGFGSQRLEEQLAEQFHDARVARIDSDSMAGRDYYRVLKDFSDGRIDILAGTQMLAKGLHFPNVTLVGIISADTCLSLPDFASSERTFQLISQVAGRAGRSVKKGTVFVQTFLAGQPAIKFALANDYEGFVKEELKHRRACNLPPFWRLAVIIMRDRDFDKLSAACTAMRERIDFIVQQDGLKIKVRGPLPAMISRIQRFHRMQIILQAPQAETIRRLFTSLRNQPPFRPTVKVAVDMDPVNLL